MSELSTVENVGLKQKNSKIGQKMTDLGYILLFFWLKYRVYQKQYLLGLMHAWNRSDLPINQLPICQLVELLFLISKIESKLAILEPKQYSQYFDSQPIIGIYQTFFHFWAKPLAFLLILGQNWIPHTQIEWNRSKFFENRSRIGRDRHVFIQKLAFRAEIPRNPTYSKEWL